MGRAKRKGDEGAPRATGVGRGDEGRGPWPFCGERMIGASMRVAVAWAGGVGSMLALEAALSGTREVVLVHVVAQRAPPPSLVQEQAAALGLPLRLVEGPEIPALASALRDAKVDQVCFGYLRGEEHAGMFTLARAARDAGVEPSLPARHLRPDVAARRSCESGHRAFVRRVARPVPPAWLGRFFDAPAVEEFEAEFGRTGWAGIRTLVVEGPRFARKVQAAAGEPELVSEGEWRLPLGVLGC